MELCRVVIILAFFVTQHAYGDGYCSKELYAKLIDGSSMQEDSWGVDQSRSDSRPYEVDFGDLLDGKSFSQYFAERKQNGQTTHLLDLFGSGIVTIDFASIDSVTAARLKKTTIERMKVPDLLKGFEIITGDLFDKKTWLGLEESLKRRNIASIDTITIRPVGAFTGLEHDLAGTIDPKTADPEMHREFLRLYMGVVAQAYSKLSIGGDIFLQLPVYGSELTNGYQVWQQALQAAHIQVRFPEQGFKRVVRLTKTAESLSQLPLNSF